MDINTINVISLVYLGDSVYELYIREKLIYNGLGKVDDMQKEAVKYVSAKAQSKIVSDMINSSFLFDDEIDVIKAKVVDLVKYNNFSEVVDNYDMKIIYLEGYTKEMYLNEMRRFYTLEDEVKYGALAIIFEVFDDEA